MSLTLSPSVDPDVAVVDIGVSLSRDNYCAVGIPLLKYFDGTVGALECVFADPAAVSYHYVAR